jgi:hypothetical protein
MSEMPVAIASRIQAAVRDAMGALRTRAQAGPVTEQAIDDILFRGTHEIMQALGQEPRDTRFLLWPSAVRPMLATFLEDVVQQDERRVL